MKKNELRSSCPINYALENLGDKWTLLVIRDLIFEGKKFYKEFLSSKEGIATNILSDRLKKLENLGIVQSQVYEKQRTQKMYTLTTKGKDLIPVLLDLIVWSAKYQRGLNISDDFVQEIEDNRSNIISDIGDNVGTTKYSSHPA